MRITKDGKAYDGTDAVITALGQVWDEVSDFTYATTMEHQKNWTIGSQHATSWSKGKIDNTGSISLLMNQAVGLEKACKGDLLGIKPFDINVTFVDEFLAIVNDTITCKFASQGRAINTEMGLAHQYELFVLDIKYNNVG